MVDDIDEQSDGTATHDVDVVVVGGGPVGENVADRVVKGGLSAALVESRLLGGECSYYACVPSKALLRPGTALEGARTVDGARQAVTGALDAESALARRTRLTDDWTDDGQVDWLAEANIDLARGHGRLGGRADRRRRSRRRRHRHHPGGARGRGGDRHVSPAAADPGPGRGGTVDQPRGHERRRRAPPPGRPRRRAGRVRAGHGVALARQRGGHHRRAQPPVARPGRAVRRRGRRGRAGGARHRRVDRRVGHPGRAADARRARAASTSTAASASPSSRPTSCWWPRAARRPRPTSAWRLWG